MYICGKKICVNIRQNAYYEMTIRKSGIGGKEIFIRV